MIENRNLYDDRLNDHNKDAIAEIAKEINKVLIKTKMKNKLPVGGAYFY